MTKDYYGILEVSRDANEEEIKKAYRSLAQEWHPDKHPEEEDQKKAEEKFKEISEAYSVLADKEKRGNYDATGSPDGTPFNFSTTGDPFDIASRFGFNIHRTPPQPIARKGQNVRVMVRVSLAEALFGVNVPIKYQTVSACSVCKGHGGVDFEVCTACNGRGVRVQQRPGMIMQQTCGECRGQGKRIKTVCSQCNGHTYVEEEKTLGVFVPAGINNGATLRVAEKGGAGFSGGPPGDVFIEVQVQNPDLSGLSDDEQVALRELLSK
jgi:molecular chaperone DnaJ